VIFGSRKAGLKGGHLTSSAAGTWNTSWKISSEA
jgi:hypothetical protein